MNRIAACGMPTSAKGDRSSRGANGAILLSLWSFSSARSLAAGQNATPNPIKLSVTLYFGRAQQAASATILFLSLSATEHSECLGAGQSPHCVLAGPVTALVPHCVMRIRRPLIWCEARVCPAVTFCLLFNGLALCR